MYIYLRVTRFIGQYHRNGSGNNLDTDFGSWTQDAGLSIIGLHRLDSTSAAGDGLVAITLESIGHTNASAISRARAADFMISIDS
jgi:hypothetical protein